MLCSVQDQKADVSPWHDVALHNDDGSLNFVCEIPKDTSAKFEVATVQKPLVISRLPWFLCRTPSPSVEEL